MTKKLLPKIKAIVPETAEVMESDARVLDIELEFFVTINGEKFDYCWRNQFTNFFDALVIIRKSLIYLYAFLNTNLGTHYVVKNDTESNLKDLGYVK